MRRITEEDLTLVDATGERYPPRLVAWKLLDTAVRFVLLVGVLYLVAVCWEAFA